MTTAEVPCESRKQNLPELVMGGWGGARKREIGDVYGVSSFLFLCFDIYGCSYQHFT